jgi:hypothetical protein
MFDGGTEMPGLPAVQRNFLSAGRELTSPSGKVVAKRGESRPPSRKVYPDGVSESIPKEGIARPPFRFIVDPTRQR